MPDKIAKIVLVLPINEPFDYLIPKRIKNIKIGARVLVPFREKKLIGYVVSFSKYSRFKKLRSILKLIDKIPLLDKQLLDLARELSCYYFSSLGEAIKVVLPGLARKK